jgi:uncharacterized protein
MTAMHSALYRGRVSHRRLTPRPHAFGYQLFMVYLDLAELDLAFHGRWFWSNERANLASFRRADHVGPPSETLDQSVRKLVLRDTGRLPSGPIRLLTHLRYFGYCFNPVSFYYCFDAADTRVETIVAEVNNTPWGERHCYVLPVDAGSTPGQHWRWQFDKQFHVSPFMPMDMQYDWRFGDPGQSLAVYMAAARAGGKTFDANMTLQRQPIGASSLATALLRFPLMTLQVIVAIHWQALRLWLKGVPVHTHLPPKSV